MDKFQFHMEKEKLENTIKEYKEVMKSYNLRIQAIPKLYSNNLEMMENALKFYDEKLDLIKKILVNHILQELILREMEKVK